MTIAPWQVHFCPIRMDDENVSAVADELYKKMNENGIDVLFDDRNVSAGIKLTDSELMGMPIRVVISPKTMANSEAEVTIRETGERIFLPIKELIPELKAMIEDEINEFLVNKFMSPNEIELFKRYLLYKRREDLSNLVVAIDSFSELTGRIATLYDEREQIYCFSAMIVYNDC